jgi:hypothetical protein
VNCPANPTRPLFKGVTMKATALYRIAAVLFIVFAAGHTVGFLGFRPPTTEAAAVRDAMKNVHFQVGGSSFTYGGFYTGFGLFATLYLLFAAYLAWHLGGGSRHESAGDRRSGVGLRRGAGGERRAELDLFCPAARDHFCARGRVPRPGHVAGHVRPSWSCAPEPRLAMRQRERGEWYFREVSMPLDR